MDDTATSRPRVYSVEEAAKVLRISRTSAFRAVERGEIPTIRIGRSIRVPRYALEKLLGEIPLGEEDEKQ